MTTTSSATPQGQAAHVSRFASSRPRRSAQAIRVFGIVLALFIIGGVAWGVSTFLKQRTIRLVHEACQMASQRQLWSDLKRESDRWTRLEPNSADAWLFRGEAAEEEKDWTTLADCLARVPKTDARIVRVLTRKMIAEFEQLNRPYDGFRTCDEILAIDDRVLVAHTQAIFFCAMTLRRNEMVERIRRAIRLGRESPGSYVFLASSSWAVNEAIFKHTNDWLKDDPDNEELIVARAMTVYVSEVKDDATRIAEFSHIPPVDTLIKRFPKNTELVAYLIDRSIVSGDLPAVEDLLGRIDTDVIERDPRFCRAKAWIADVSGDIDSAISWLKRSLDSDPYWWQSYFVMKELQRRAGRKAEADWNHETWQLSVDLGKAIGRLGRFEQAFATGESFPRLLLTFAQRINDNETVEALRKRIGQLQPQSG